MESVVTHASITARPFFRKEAIRLCVFIMSKNKKLNDKELCSLTTLWRKNYKSQFDNFIASKK